jgi:hypothetical protein
MSSNSSKLILTLVFLVVAYANVQLASAAITGTYTNQAALQAALQAGYYAEDFSAYNGYYGINSPLPFAGGNGFAYDLSAPSGLFAIPAGGGSLSTNDDGDLLTISFSGNPVTGVGGLFFLNNNAGNYISGLVTLAYANDTHQVLNISGSGPSDYWGFTSDAPIVSMTIAGGGSGSSAYPGVDNLTVGSAVPEPASVIVWSMLALVVTAGWWRRRTLAS